MKEKYRMNVVYHVMWPEISKQETREPIILISMLAVDCQVKFTWQTSDGMVLIIKHSCLQLVQLT